MNLAIIGCGGFIGSHALDRLLRDESVHIRGWDLQTRKITHHLDNPRLRLYKHAISEPGREDDLHDTVRWADTIINLAAICNPSEYNTNPLEVIRANFIDVHPLVELCAAECKWLISFSTSEVYGRTLAGYLPGNRYDDPNLYELGEDETPLIMGPISNQRWTYACAKQLLERFIYAHHHKHGMPFTIVRPFNFFGPRMDYLPGHDGEGVPRVLASLAVDSKQFYGTGYEDCDRRMPKLDQALTLLGWAPRIPLREILMETMTYYHHHYGQSSTHQ